MARGSAPWASHAPIVLVGGYDDVSLCGFAPHRWFAVHLGIFGAKISLRGGVLGHIFAICRGPGRETSRHILVQKCQIGFNPLPAKRIKIVKIT